MIWFGRHAASALLGRCVFPWLGLGGMLPAHCWAGGFCLGPARAACPAHFWAGGFCPGLPPRMSGQMCFVSKWGLSWLGLGCRLPARFRAGWFRLDLARAAGPARFWAGEFSRFWAGGFVLIRLGPHATSALLGRWVLSWFGLGGTPSTLLGRWVSPWVGEGDMLPTRFWAQKETLRIQRHEHVQAKRNA